MTDSESKPGARAWFSLLDGAGFALVLLAGLGGLSLLARACNDAQGMGIQDRLAAVHCVDACGEPAEAECVRACMCAASETTP